MVFLVHVGAMAAWTVVEVVVAFRYHGDDWLHGLIVYMALNVGFLVAYVLVWFVGRHREHRAASL
jgi:hypothetical protein